MKLKLLLILAVFIFSNSVFASDQDNNKYPVTKYVGMYSYRAPNLKSYISRDGSGKLKKKIVLSHDNHGNIIAKTHFYKDMKIKLKMDYKFDSQKRLIKKIKISPDAKIIRMNSYSYNDNNLMIKEEVSNSDNIIIRKIRYYYNSNGERIRKVSKNMKGKIKGISIYVFDSKGRRAWDYSLTGMGTIKRSNKYSYNIIDQLIKKESFKPGLGLSSSTINSYDKKGHRIESKRFNSKGELKSSLVYSYR